MTSIMSRCILYLLMGAFFIGRSKRDGMTASCLNFMAQLLFHSLIMDMKSLDFFPDVDVLMQVNKYYISILEPLCKNTFWDSLIKVLLHHNAKHVSCDFFSFVFFAWEVKKTIGPLEVKMYAMMLVCFSLLLHEVLILGCRIDTEDLFIRVNIIWLRGTEFVCCVDNKS